MIKFEKFILILYLMLLTGIYIVITILPTGIFSIQILDNYYNALTKTWNFAIISLALILLNLYFLYSISKGEGSTKSGVVKYTSDGELIISIDALKSLVLKSIANVRGIKDVKVYIRPGKEKLNILIKTIVFPDLNIPGLVKEIQENTKSYVEMIAEIPVGEVKVLVEDITSTTKLRME